MIVIAREGLTHKNVELVEPVLMYSFLSKDDTAKVLVCASAMVENEQPRVHGAELTSFT